LRLLWLDEFRGDLQPLSYLTMLEELSLRHTNGSLQYCSSLTRLRWLDVGGTSISDDLPTIVSLTNLRDLNLWDCDITPRGMGLLHRLNVERLNLYGTAADDETVRILTSVTTLTELDLGRTKITDKGIQELTILSKLTDLNLAKSQVTDVGVEALHSLTNLKLLSLDYCRMSDVGLRGIASLPSLQELRIRCTGVTDKGLQQYLSSQTTLTWLDLTDCYITDQGLQALCSLTRLQHLLLNGCSVTAGGLASLQLSLRYTRLDVRFRSAIRARTPR